MQGALKQASAGAPLLQAGGAAGTSTEGTPCLTCSNGRPVSLEDGKQRGR